MVPNINKQKISYNINECLSEIFFLHTLKICEFEDMAKEA